MGKKVDPIINNDFRFGDTRNDLSDNSKVEKDLGFRTKYPFREGIKELVDWSETQKAEDKFELAEIKRKKLLGK